MTGPHLTPEREAEIRADAGPNLTLRRIVCAIVGHDGPSSYFTLCHFKCRRCGRLMRWA